MLAAIKKLLPFYFNTRMNKIYFLLIVLFLNSSVKGGGFQLNLQGQKQTGMGHTGTGLLTDASITFFNPGGICFLDTSFNINFGTSLIFPRVVYREPFPGGYTAETVHNIGTPFSLYATWKKSPNDAFAFGLGVYTPFGSKQQWEDDWLGQFLIREINLKTIFIQPTMSFRLHEKAGIGFGFVFATGSFGLRKGVPVQNSAGEYGEGVLKGKASGAGFNAGIYLKPFTNFTLGISYRSSVKTSVTGGAANFDVASSIAEYFPSTTFNTKIKLPSVTTLGLGYTCKNWRFALDVNYVTWSSYDSLIIDFEDNTDKLADIHSARLYQNSFIFRIGSEYKINSIFTARLGAYYDLTPVQDGYLTPETPDTDKLGITCGLSIYPIKKMHIDLSFLFIEGKQRYDQNLETEFAGTYKSRALIPGIGFGFIF